MGTIVKRGTRARPRYYIQYRELDHRLKMRAVPDARTTAPWSMPVRQVGRGQLDSLCQEADAFGCGQLGLTPFAPTDDLDAFGWILPNGTDLHQPFREGPKSQQRDPLGVVGPG
jgi:hypothetical protein